ncbi:E3 ubiquitin-protein ligase TRIM39-like [Genypterus blacodes]|uniref:E3 ubiquitin-protein ligase TRIM39-like n=1 Tax=Genypterus blacodes TaxID=154954 RepID=UPI003F774C7F
MAYLMDSTLSETLECSICYEVFTDPVTLPCVHNFCKLCITKHLKMQFPFNCPLCKATFVTRPSLRVNLTIADMSECFRQSMRQPKKITTPSHLEGSEKQEKTKPEDVLCDVCNHRKMKAVKSCMVCLASYCQSHLDSHHSTAGLRSHLLVDPVKNLENRICKKHDKPIEFYCTTDKMSICIHCTIMDHKSHLFRPLNEEYSKKKGMLKTLDAELKMKIQKRQMKIDELKKAEKINKEAAETKIAEGVEVLTSLMKLLEGGLVELMDTIQEKQRITQGKAESYIKELKQEISELTKRAADVEELCVVRAVDDVKQTYKRDKKKLLEVELKRVQQFRVDLTLNPATASAWLNLSHDGKQVHLGDMKRSLPNNSERFHPKGGVLAKQSFSSGRFYYEVFVKEKTNWDLGVVCESINRKVKLTQNKDENHWILSLRKGKEYKAKALEVFPFSRTWYPQKVGVFVDYEEGVVSFYNVDGVDIIYSFTGCSFTEKLYPFFSPGQNLGGKTTPLIIAYVIQSD